MADLPNLLEWLKTLAPIGALLASLGALIVFTIGLLQYIRAESWKKTEFVAKLYKEFSDNDDCKRALWILQGDRRKLHYKEGDKLVGYDYDHEVLIAALTDAAAKPKKQLTPAQLHIRDTLDTFFVHLEQFERAIQRNLVSQDDVYPYFGYWILLLIGHVDIGQYKAAVVGSIHTYIHDAQFDDVQSFLKRKWEYGLHPEEPRMLSKELHENDHEIGEHDERDLEDQLRSQPLATPAPSIRSPDDDPALSRPAAAAPGQKIAIVNRGLPTEAVAGCQVSVGTVSATANDFGNATLELSTLGNGPHDLIVNATHSSELPVGPGFPQDTDKLRIWRPFRGRLVIRNGVIVSGEPSEWIAVTDGQTKIRLQPAWLRSGTFSNRSASPDMIVIHHTAGTLESDLRTFLFGGAVSIHYLVAPNGEIYKLVDESKTAFHAGVSFWQGDEAMNSRSIGIEMTHRTGVEYPAAQVDAVVDLVRRLRAAFPNIPAGRVIGHSDIGICHPNSANPCTPAGPKRLGRKSTDPGSAFPWERIETLGLGLRMAEGAVRPDIYGGYFQLVPNGKLRNGDSDNEHRYDGQIRPTVNGAVRELQQDLSRIGYFCPADGEFGQVTVRALQMFQQHMFSGSRRLGHPDMFNSGDGTLQLKTADVVKRVLGEVVAAPVA